MNFPINDSSSPKRKEMDNYKATCLMKPIKRVPEKTISRCYYRGCYRGIVLFRRESLKIMQKGIKSSGGRSQRTAAMSILEQPFDRDTKM